MGEQLRPLTPFDIEVKIRRLMRGLEETLDKLGEATEKRAEAQSAFDVAYLTAYETERHAPQKSSEKDRDNAAKLAAMDQRSALLLADGLVDVLRAKQAAMRDELSACQTLAKFVADEAGMNRYGRAG